MSDQLIWILICMGIATPISILWVNGIHYMKENHPNYKGYDLFDEEEPKKPTK